MTNGGSFKPQHTRDESTMIFDTHPCTAQGAQRVYGGTTRPAVCTVEEYSDIFGIANDKLNYPLGCFATCFGPPTHEEFLHSLRNRYPHLHLDLRNHFHGFRYIYVLSIKRKQQQGLNGLPYNDFEVPSGAPLPPPIPVVQAIPVQTMTDRK